MNDLNTVVGPVVSAADSALTGIERSPRGHQSVCGSSVGQGERFFRASEMRALIRPFPTRSPLRRLTETLARRPRDQSRINLSGSTETENTKQFRSAHLHFVSSPAPCRSLNSATHRIAKLHTYTRPGSNGNYGCIQSDYKSGQRWK